MENTDPHDLSINALDAVFRPLADHRRRTVLAHPPAAEDGTTTLDDLIDTPVERETRSQVATATRAVDV